MPTFKTEEEARKARALMAFYDADQRLRKATATLEQYKEIVGNAGANSTWERLQERWTVDGMIMSNWPTDAKIVACLTEIEKRRQEAERALEKLEYLGLRIPDTWT